MDRGSWGTRIAGQVWGSDECAAELRVVLGNPRTSYEERWGAFPPLPRDICHWTEPLAFARSFLVHMLAQPTPATSCKTARVKAEETVGNAFLC